MDTPDHVKLTMAYDDLWLRELLGSIQTDVREQRIALRDHAQEDRERWDELHACLDAVSDKVDEVQRTVAKASSLGRFAWNAIKWCAGVVGGGGGALGIWHYIK